MPHLCHAIDCQIEVPPKMFMCFKHWKMVPKKLQISIWNEYRPGQEVDKNPSLKYCAVQQFAVGEVADKEGKKEQAQAAYQNAMRFAMMAKEKESW